MKNVTGYPIDSEKLRLYLKLRGYALEKASVQMGFGKTYLNQVLRRGMVTPSGAKLIETELGIGLDLYKKEEVKEVPELEAEPEDCDCNCEIANELKEIKELLRQILEVLS